MKGSQAVLDPIWSNAIPAAMVLGTQVPLVAPVVQGPQSGTVMGAGGSEEGQTEDASEPAFPLSCPLGGSESHDRGCFGFRSDALDGSPEIHPHGHTPPQANSAPSEFLHNSEISTFFDPRNSSEVNTFGAGGISVFSTHHPHLTFLTTLQTYIFHLLE